jgi:DNA-binding beta-propeller fold protein YncE
MNCYRHITCLRRRRMNNKRTLFHTTLLVLILAPGLFANVHFALALTDGTGTMEGDTGVEPGQASDLVFELGSQDAAEITNHLSLLNNATVVGASMTVIPGPGPASPAGGGKDVTVYPDRPWVDVGADGTIEWAFDGIGYGEAGHQTLFGNGASGIQLGPGSPTDHSWTITDQSTNPIIRLPRNASLESARLLLEPKLRTDWWNVSWLRRVPFEIKALGDGLSPARIEREIPLEGNYRDPASELRLTQVDNKIERPYPFWVVSSSLQKATIGFELSWTEPQVVKKFYLYYDNPSVTTSVALAYVPVPLTTMFEGEKVPPKSSAPGAFSLCHPMGLFQSSNGTLFIADSGNSRVLMLDTTGKIQGTLGVNGQPGIDNNHFEVPNDVAVDISGNIIVSDGLLERVQIYKPDGTYMRTLGVTNSRGSDSSHLNTPWAVAVDKDGHLYISDNGNDRVQVFESLSASTAKWTYGTTIEPGWDPAHLDSPRGLSYSGGLYVADTYNARVQKFTTLTDKVSKQSFGLERLITPSDVAVGKGHVFVSDTDLGKVLEFDTEGYFLGELSDLTWPMGVAVGPTGDLWVLETGADRVLRIINATFTAEAVQTLSFPSDLSLSLDGRSLANYNGPLMEPQELDGLEGHIKGALEHCQGVKDAYGNLMCALKLNIDGPDPGPNTTLTINGLDIRYHFSTRMSVALAPGTYGGGEGAKYLPVKASSRNGGRIGLEAITLKLDRPPFPLLPDRVPSVPEGTDGSKVLDLSAIFSDEGSLNFTIEVLAGPDGTRAWVGYDGALMLDLSADPNSTQVLRLNITASDALGQSTSIDLTIPVEGIPDPPYVEPVWFKATCNQLFSARILAVDGDNDTMLFYLVDGPSGLSLGPDGLIDWNPRPNQVGAFVLEFTVTDGLFDVLSNATIEVGCIEHSPQVEIDDEVTVLSGEMLRVPMNLTDTDGDDLTVTLRNAPKGLKFDASLMALIWRPSLEDVGDHLMMLSISDGKLAVLKALRIEVLRPVPWVRLLAGPDKIDSSLIFTGRSGSSVDKVRRVEYRIDSGSWSQVEGKDKWHAKVNTRGLSPGEHIVEFRAYDGLYSDAIKSSFSSIPEAKSANNPWSFEGLSLGLLVLVILIITLGGVYMLKTHDGFVFCVQKGPDGPMMSIPIGNKAVTAGGTASVDDEVDVAPEQPPRNIRCIVCLGHIKGAEDYIECPRCGRVYHKACASRILSCVMCGSDLVKEES